MTTCEHCGHTHHGPELGGICVGCPCPDAPAEHGLTAEQVDHLRRVLRAVRGPERPGSDYHDGERAAFTYALAEIERLMREPWDEPVDPTPAPTPPAGLFHCDTGARV